MGGCLEEKGGEVKEGGREREGRGGGGGKGGLVCLGEKRKAVIYSGFLLWWDDCFV